MEWLCGADFGGLLLRGAWARYRRFSGVEER